MKEDEVKGKIKICKELIVKANEFYNEMHHLCHSIGLNCPYSGYGNTHEVIKEANRYIDQLRIQLARMRGD